MLPTASPPAKSKPSPQRTSLKRDLLILLGLWLVVAVFDRTWIWMDQIPPHWDSGDHLSRALDHWRVLQNPQWFSGEWWRTLWEQAPTQRAPLVYLLTAPYFTLFGVSTDSAVTVNLFFTALLLGSVYAMGRRLFNASVGLWAAGLSLLAPVLGRLRLDYMLDYGLTVVTAFTAMGLTYWWTAKSRRGQWGFTLLWGFGVGLMLLARTSGLLFVVAMVGWLGVLCLFSRQWGRILQLIAGVVVGIAVIWPWFSTSWLTITSTTLESTSHGITIMGSPQANTLAGWLFYPQELPGMLSSPVLFLGLAAGLLALVGLIFPFSGGKPQPLPNTTTSPRRAWLWLGGIILVILFFGALGANKQARLLAPIVPFLCVALARLLWWRQDRTWQALRWLAAVGSAILLLWTTFPVPGANLFPQRTRWFPYTGEIWPHEDMIAAMTAETPHLEVNLGIIPNTPEIQVFNLGFYGSAADFQVNTREVGMRTSATQQDAQALDWYITKTGDQGPLLNEEARTNVNTAVANSPELEVWNTWPLPDGSEARIHHRQEPWVEVEPVNQTVERVTLSEVAIPEPVTAGQTTPVTYRLVGPWDDLKNGLLLLSWTSEEANNPPQWIGDHGIGLGRLYGDEPANAGFSVVERLGVVPPADLPPGTYRLAATFVHRDTQESYAVELPTTEVEVLPTPPEAELVPAVSPPLDLVTVLRQLSQGLGTGDIDPVFSEVGRINQYDPPQDYLIQAEKALDFRLQEYPDNLDWLYGKALSHVLQQDAPAAIAALTRITEVAPDNPYHWAYLGFVHLYSWQPRQAQAALDQAAALDPDLPDLKVLQAAAAIMQLQIPRGIDLLKQEGVL